MGIFLVGKLSALIAFCLLFIGMAWAQPSIPHQFYGYVTINGNPADNAPIIAEVKNASGTVATSSSTASSNGTYGFSPYIFYVEDPNGNNSGKTIEFFLSGQSVATYTFETGAHTRLDLFIGNAPECGDGICNADEDSDSCPGDCEEPAAPFCGDNSCNGSETCSSCEADCGPCPAAPGPSGGPSGGGPSGGGSTNRLQVEVEGKCVGQETVVTVLNTVGNPARGADVKAVKDRITVEQKDSDEEGKAIFAFSETGEYYIYVTKTNYSQNTQKIEVVECEEGQTSVVEEETEGASLCDNVDCDDDNPCTTEYCATQTGHCIYENQPDDMPCGAVMSCQQGVCVSPETEVSEEGLEGDGQAPVGFFGLGAGSGFFGLSLGQAGAAGLLIIALIALCLLIAGKRRKKK